MLFSSLRNYFSENITRLRNEWKNFQHFDSDPILTSEAILDSDTRRFYTAVRSTHEQDIKILESEFQALRDGFELRNAFKHEPFELYVPTLNLFND